MKTNKQRGGGGVGVEEVLAEGEKEKDQGQRKDLERGYDKANQYARDSSFQKPSAIFHKPASLCGLFSVFLS